MTNPLLSLRHVSYFWGSRPVFKHLNLDIFSGQVFLLRGPNGAGKSTLLRLLAGFIQPTSGNITRNLGSEKVGIMGHECAIYPSLTARENLIFWARLYQLRDKDIDELLSSVGLGDFAAEKAGVFSRGMAQRLNLARILLLDPQLLLLDEPTTGLDEHCRSFFYARVQNWKQLGKAVVWVSHDFEQEEQLADTCFFLRTGRFVNFSGENQEGECLPRA